MWFRLALDYQTHGDEIHYSSWDTVMIKKGAPVSVSFMFREKDVIISNFVFAGGGLYHIDLHMLDLPNSCVKSFDGDVFCATKRMFFYGSYHRGRELLANQLLYCPLCGEELEEQADFPREEKSSIYEVKRKPSCV